MTRTDELLAAVKAELEARRAEIDAEEHLSRLEVDMRFRPGHHRPRKTVIRKETDRASC